MSENIVWRQPHVDHRITFSFKLPNPRLKKWQRKIVVGTARKRTYERHASSPWLQERLKAELETLR